MKIHMQHPECLADTLCGMCNVSLAAMHRVSDQIEQVTCPTVWGPGL